MTLTVRQFPCLSDNYGLVIRDEASGKTACVDTPDEKLSGRLGVEIVRLEAREVKAAYERVGADALGELREETGMLYDVRVEGEGYERSLRAACRQSFCSLKSPKA